METLIALSSIALIWLIFEIKNAKTIDKDDPNF